MAQVFSAFFRSEAYWAPMLIFRTFLAVLAITLGLPISAQAQTAVGTYGARWAGLPVGTVTITNSSDPAGGSAPYAFSMTLQSGGILGSSRFTTTFSARGQVDERWLSPAVGRFTDVRRNETRRETIQFSNGMPSFSSEPAYLIPEEFQFDMERTRGSFDPSSGMFMLLQAAAWGDCDRQFPVFDGFSLYAARITDMGQENVRTRLYRGPSQKCGLTLTPIAGKAAVFGSFIVPEMEVNVAQVAPGTPAIPVRGSLVVNGSRATLRLTDFTVQ